MSSQVGNTLEALIVKHPWFAFAFLVRIPHHKFIIFTILSLIGLVINELIIKVSIDVLYENWTWLKNLIGPTTVTAAAKIVATAIVMVYNFITRKIFLEQKEG